MCLFTGCDDYYYDDDHDTIMVVAFTPLSRLEDRKFGFLLRNKTISLNICIDVREVFNAKVTIIIITLTPMTTRAA